MVFSTIFRNDGIKLYIFSFIYSFLLLRHGFPWLFDILGMVNFGENPTTSSAAFQWVQAVMYLKQRLSLHNASTLLFVHHYY